MKIVCEIKPDEKDPKKCGASCNLKAVNGYENEICVLDWEHQFIGLDNTRCQSCLDAEAEYNTLQNAIAERDEAPDNPKTAH